MKVALIVTIFVLPALSALQDSPFGEQQEVDASRDDVRRAADFALQEMNSRASSHYSDMLLRIVKATTKVTDEASKWESGEEYVMKNRITDRPLWQWEQVSLELSAEPK